MRIDSRDCRWNIFSAKSRAFAAQKTHVIARKIVAPMRDDDARRAPHRDAHFLLLRAPLPTKHKAHSPARRVPIVTVTAGAFTRDAALVAIGAACGAVARFGVSSMIPSRTVPAVVFPWATLAVNLVGSFAIGLLMLPTPASHPMRLLMVVGFLGGLTTLSTYSLETITLLRSGAMGLALANVIANGLVGPLMAVSGGLLRGRLWP